MPARSLADLHAKARTDLLGEPQAKTQAGEETKQARCLREAAAWARRLQRCPIPVPFFANSARRAFRWVPGRSRTGIFPEHSRCSNPTCRSGRPDNIRRVPAPTGFLKCVREWALSGTTDGANGDGAWSFSFSPRRMNSAVAESGNTAQDACRGKYARRCGSARCAKGFSDSAHGRFSARNAKTCVKRSGARER